MASVTIINSLTALYTKLREGKCLIILAERADGKLSFPVLTLHTTRDPLVPLFHEPVYAAIVDAAGKSDLLVQRVIDRFGHCEFTLEEQIEAFQDLVNWVENGVKPTP